jgi:hypothetical protein
MIQAWFTPAPRSVLPLPKLLNYGPHSPFEPYARALFPGKAMMRPPLAASVASEVPGAGDGVFRVSRAAFLVENVWIE